MSFSDLNKISILSLLALFAFSLYFYWVGYKEEIPVYMEIMRILFTAHYFGLVYVTLRVKLSKEFLYFILFLSFIAISFLLQYWQLYETNTIYGNSRDSYVYLSLATKYNHYSLLDFWHAVLNQKYLNINVDDLGFTTIMYFISKPFGKDYIAIANMLILCNGIIYLVGIRCFHKLSEMLLCNNKRAVMATVLWACFSRLITTSASGAKEVFFTAFVIIAMYSIYRYKEQPTWLRLIIAILLITINYFFRFAICFALILALICIIVTNEQNKRTIVRKAFWVILFTFPILTFILPLMTGGITLDYVLWVTGNRMEKVSGSSLTKFVFPPCSLLFGPFPNLDRLNSKGFVYAYSLFLKDFLSIYFLLAFASVIKKYKYKYYPLLVFIFCNMLMLIIAGVTLDIRYHLTYIPFFFLICMLPYESKWNDYKKYVIYLCICLVIFIYSNRAFIKDTYQINSKFLNIGR